MRYWPIAERFTNPETGKLNLAALKADPAYQRNLAEHYRLEPSDEALTDVYAVGAAAYEPAAWAAIVAEMAARALERPAPVEEPPPSALPSADPLDAARSYVARLWRGEIPLVVTFWVWGVGVGAGLRVANALIIPRRQGGLGESPLLGLALCYQLFMYECVWRSSGRYRGPTAWGVLARVWATLWLVYSLAFLVELVQ